MKQKQPKPGDLQILSVGEGDTTYSFNAESAAERAKAKKIVEDILKKGYAIFVTVGDLKGEPMYVRAKSFDPVTGEYLIFGLSDEELEEMKEGKPRVAKKKVGRPRKKKASAKRVPATKARAVAVARSAGG